MTTGTTAGPDRTVLVTGAAGVLGRRVLRLVAADPAVERVVAVDLAEPPDPGPRVEVRTLDLKDEADLAQVRELARTADGLIAGFRPGVMERLGLGPEVLHSDNLRLVYGRITG